LKKAIFRDLSVDIVANVIDTQTNVILTMVCNAELEFTVDEVKKLAKCPKRFNFN
jgi:hypothetical protein